MPRSHPRSRPDVEPRGSGEAHWVLAVILAGLPGPGAAIAAARWDDAAKMALAMGPEAEVTCVGEDARGFASVATPASSVGRDVVLVVRRRPGPEPLVAYATYFDSLRALEGVSLQRGGREEVAVSVYLGQRLRRALPRLQR